MGMLKYSIGRLLRALVTMAAVLSAVFLLMRLLPVEGYFGDRSDAMNEKVKEQVLKSLGLLDPWYKQLGNFWKNLLHGDMGKSIVYRKGVSVVKIIVPKAKVSLKFGFAAIMIEKLAGIPMGVLMARYKGKFFDRFGNLYILLINALPAAVYYLLIQLGGSGLFGVSMLYKPGQIGTMILPVISLSLGGIASTAMWMRRYMVDQMNMDYIRLARAKGMTGSQVAFRHMLRNAFIPMAQSLPVSILFTISGSLYIESLYSIPGMGGLLVTAIKRQDNTLVQALVLLFSVLSIVGMLLGDILMMLLDPRITLGDGKGEGR